MTDKDFFNKLWDESPMGRSGCCTPIAIAVFVGVLFMLCSCATRHSIEYVDREIVKYETKVQHDTLINNIHDSVYHTVFQKGDTIYDTKYVERTRFKDRVVVRTDTVCKQKVKTEIKENTKEVIKIPKLLWISMCFSIIVIIFAIIKVIRWVQIH